MQRLVDIGTRATLALYGSARLVIASRFHGVIFAALAGCAIVPVCKPDTKIGYLMRHGLPAGRREGLVGEQHRSGAFWRFRQAATPEP